MTRLNTFYLYLLTQFRYANFPVSSKAQKKIWEGIQNIDLNDTSALYEIINPIVNHSPRNTLTNVKELIQYSLNTDGMRNFVTNLFINTIYYDITDRDLVFNEVKKVIEKYDIDNCDSTSSFVINLSNHINNIPSIKNIVNNDTLIYVQKALKFFDME
jgi:hypothetical protein